MARRIAFLILMGLSLSGCLTHKKSCPVNKIEGEPGSKVIGVYWRGNFPHFIYSKRKEGEKIDTVQYSLSVGNEKVVYVVYEK